MTHLLDSSALLAFYFDEPGGTQVKALFEDDNNSIAVSVLSASEFWARLKSVNREAEFEKEWEIHRPLFDAVLDLDWSVAKESIAIRRAASKRLPAIDSLIAATAAVHGLSLVHRDPHFRAIPRKFLRQLDLDSPASKPKGKAKGKP